jgi:hypothetical protein
MAAEQPADVKIFTRQVLRFSRISDESRLGTYGWGLASLNALYQPFLNRGDAEVAFRLYLTWARDLRRASSASLGQKE